MVSEGDLIHPERAARESRRQTWLEVLAEGGSIAPEFCLAAVKKSYCARHHFCSCDYGE
jgi:hypothetical protein